MKLHTTLLIAAAALATTPLLADDAQACSPRYYAPGVKLVTSGEVAQSARLIVEFYGEADAFEIALEDASGADIPLTLEAEDGYFQAEFGSYGRRVIFSPESALTPGDYTLINRTERPEWQDDSTPFDESSSFTVTSELPPEGAPASPTLYWTAVAYDGPEDPELLDESRLIDSCGFGGPDTSIARLRVDATQEATQAVGHVTVEAEDFTGTVQRTISSPTTASATLSDQISLYESDPFIQCVSATFTDIYGRTSAPTRSCKPDECAALGRNDRDGEAELRKGSLCEDWSPGFAERNAPGCGCAQAPGAPAGAPWALAVALLGLWRLQNRRPDHTGRQLER